VLSAKDLFHDTSVVTELWTFMFTSLALEFKMADNGSAQRVNLEWKNA
jgi:hypothetical protein